METPKSDAPKLPDMVMCGDHPSYTKTELNAKTDAKMDEKDTDKLKEKVLSYAKIIPSGSRTERPKRVEESGARSTAERVEESGVRSTSDRVESGARSTSERVESGARSTSKRVEESGVRSTSEYALRLREARRRVRSVEVVQRPELDVQATGNRALVQVLSSAALGSFRWPPYLLCVWVVVLLLTHVLHCLVSLLERTLPTLRKCTQFFRAWTEETWRGDLEMNQRVYPVALALVTALLYTLYYALYAAYTVVLWAIEPMCAEPDDKSRCALDVEPKVTDYEDDLKTSSSHKT